MTLPRRKFLHLAAATAAAPALPHIARAETYPSRPVHLIIGYLPGGSADMTARLFGQWLSDRLGQQVVVESRAGASTNIATEDVVRAAPDGYTLSRRRTRPMPPSTTSSTSTFSATSIRWRG